MPLVAEVIFRLRRATRVKSVRFLASQWRLLLLVVSTPILQIVFHTVAPSGFLFSSGLANSNNLNRVPLGILINASDNMSYSAWAMQAKLGHYLGSDLYTTSVHKAVFFNPYFTALGVAARILHLEPFIAMIAASVASSALFSFLVYKLARQSGLQELSAQGAVFLALFCSGPSWILFLIHAALGHGGLLSRPFLGIDGYYFDIFPESIFIAYPFASFNLALIAASAILVGRVVQGDERGALLRLVSAGVLCDCAILVRPYDALIVCFVFVVCLFCRNFTRPLRSKVRYKAEYLKDTWVCLIILPACLYVYTISELPVWKQFASKSLTTGPSRLEMVTGFSVFWFFSIIGVVRAVRAGNAKLLVLSVWAGSATTAIIVLGGLMARFSSGLIIPYSILSAYGIAGLKRRSDATSEWAYTGAMLLMLSTVTTTMFTYASILLQSVPTIDAEVKAGAYVIRKSSGEEIPTVLTDCATGAFLPGISGFRVFAGHWSLTPDFSAKCSLLARCGLSSSPMSSVFDASELGRLINEVRPQYVLVLDQSPATHWLLSTHQASVIMQGLRWDVLAMKPFAS